MSWPRQALIDLLGIEHPIIQAPMAGASTAALAAAVSNAGALGGFGGTDSAYAAEGERGQNFLRAQTVEELVGHIRRLKNEPDLRNRLVAAGRIAGQAVTPSAILQHWTRLLGETVQGAAERWRRKSAAGRRLFQAAQTVGVWLDKRLRR